jgi:DNA (cytosine-5)-methyltransferase 1
MNYYNEYDPKTAAWLRELIRAGTIPHGDVDERSIEDVRPEDLAGYTQCHFFAGIGGWSLALQLAGWSEDRPVWTGSCPYQPFSVAGKGCGTNDERHLWPVFAELIRACKPPVVFGEQVASKAGRDWLAGVFADLEGMAYQRAGADLCAAGVGAPHIRQRLYWVADLRGPRLEEWQEQPARTECQAVVGSGDAGGLANTDCERHHGQHSLLRKDQRGWNTGDFSEAPKGCQIGRLADATCVRRSEQWGTEGIEIQGGCSLGTREYEESRSDGELSRGTKRLGSASHWTDSKLIQCRDGKTRRIPTEPAFFPLVDGISPARMGILRGAGNAIVPALAAEFIAAYQESIS